MKTQSKPMISVSTVCVGSMAVNCYILTCKETKKCIIIDPGDDAEYISEKLISSQSIPSAILLTHGHFDHIMAARELQIQYAVPVYMHTNDAFLVSRMNDTAKHFLGKNIVTLPPVCDHEVHDGETIDREGISLFVVETFGHTPGSVTYVLDKTVLFVGDTIFAHGGVGRSDFSYSNENHLRNSLRIILSYPDDTLLYSGHGEMTTVGEEISC